MSSFWMYLVSLKRTCSIDFVLFGDVLITELTNKLNLVIHWKEFNFD